MRLFCVTVEMIRISHWDTIPGWRALFCPFVPTIFMCTHTYMSDLVPSGSPTLALTKLSMVTTIWILIIMKLICVGLVLVLGNVQRNCLYVWETCSELRLKKSLGWVTKCLSPWKRYIQMSRINLLEHLRGEHYKCLCFSQLHTWRNSGFLVFFLV